MLAEDGEGKRDDLTEIKVLCPKLNRGHRFGVSCLCVYNFGFLRLWNYAFKLATFSFQNFSVNKNSTWWSS